MTKEELIRTAVDILETAEGYVLQVTEAGIDYFGYELFLAMLVLLLAILIPWAFYRRLTGWMKVHMFDDARRERERFKLYFFEEREKNKQLERSLQEGVKALEEKIRTLEEKVRRDEALSKTFEATPPAFLDKAPEWKM